MARNIKTEVKNLLADDLKKLEYELIVIKSLSKELTQRIYNIECLIRLINKNYESSNSL
jgi:hypothetical protein